MADKTKDKGKKPRAVVLEALGLNDQEQANVKGGGGTIEERSRRSLTGSDGGAAASSNTLNYNPQGNK